MTITSKEHILQSANRYMMIHGAAKLSIRELANFSKCAVGTIYYHFKCKTDLMLGLYEIYWKESFDMDVCGKPYEGSFVDYVMLYWQGRVVRDRDYQSFIMPGVEKLDREDYDRYLAIEAGLRRGVADKLCEVLSRDMSVNNRPWLDAVSADKFCLFVVDAIESASEMRDADIDILRQIIITMLYGKA